MAATVGDENSMCLQKLVRRPISIPGDTSHTALHVHGGWVAFLERHYLALVMSMTTSK